MAANATLIDLGNGMIYDPVQDLTWMQDVMYARTSGADDNGRMTLEGSHAWVSNLEFGGYSDWRLPNAAPDGVDLLIHDVSDSEISRLLEHFSWCYGAFSDCDATQIEVAPFLNFYPDIEYPLFWLTYSYDGIYQAGVFWTPLYSTDLPAGDNYTAWAVRDGGNPYSSVPEPGTLGLLALGIAGLGFARRRKLN